MTSQLVDSYGRTITNLRVSLTQACNFSCLYCTPEKSFSPLSSFHYLTPLEIERFVRIASELGIDRVRLTGGEPLLRKEILEIVSGIKRVKAIRDLSITTNGSLLEALLEPLRRAGLNRINISLDSLDRQRFFEVTGTDGYEKVYRSAFAALKAGFPVKLNVVALADLKEPEILKFVQLAFDYPFEVRFLEFMPLCGPDWKAQKVLSIAEIRTIVKKQFTLSELERLDAPAQSFTIKGGKGKVGFIGSLTESFCNSCSRFRLSADGNIFPCLFSAQKVAVKELLRSGAQDQEIANALLLAASVKPKGNQFQEEPFSLKAYAQKAVHPAPRIRQIGG